MKAQAIVFGFFFWLGGAESSTAQTPTKNEVMAVQYALSQQQIILTDQPLYDGKIDGIVGKILRSAMTEYVNRKGRLDNNFWAVAFAIAEDVTWKVDWTDAVEKGVMDRIDEDFLDGPSARIKEKVLFRNADGAAACIYVNAKNSSGAYVGYAWLYFAVVEATGPDLTLFGGDKLPDTAFTLPWHNLSESEAEVWCNTGYIVGSQN